MTLPEFLREEAEIAESAGCPGEATWLREAADEIEQMRAYKERREAEDHALDIDIDRILKNLPPLKPGKASIALGKLRVAVGMETGPIGEVVGRAAEEIERLREENLGRQQAMRAYTDSLQEAYNETADEKVKRMHLQAIVDRLPKTADGVPVVPGMELWGFGHSGLARGKSDGFSVCGEYIDQPGYGPWMRCESCYSTRLAAEKARDE